MPGDYYPSFRYQLKEYTPSSENFHQLPGFWARLSYFSLHSEHQRIAHWIPNNSPSHVIIFYLPVNNVYSLHWLLPRAWYKTLNTQRFKEYMVGEKILTTQPPPTSSLSVHAVILNLDTLSLPKKLCIINGVRHLIRIRKNSY